LTTRSIMFLILLKLLEPNKWRLSFIIMDQSHAVSKPLILSNKHTKVEFIKNISQTLN
jgi:hypothetical protein